MSKPIDRETVHQNLRQTGGNAQMSAVFLGVTEQDLVNYVLGDPVLSGAWGKRIKGERVVPTGAADIPSTTLPEPSQLSLQGQVEVEEMRLLASSMEACGLTPEQIKQGQALSLFAGKSFEGVRDMAHGMLATLIFPLKDRLDEIDRILKDDTYLEVEKIIGDSVVLVKEPRYSPEVKVKWQAEYSRLIEQLRKIVETNVGATFMGDKLAKTVEKMNGTAGGDGSGGRQSRRLRPEPKQVQSA